MYSLGEVNFIQGMHDLGNCKNSVGLKPIAVRLRANSSISTAQVPPLRGVRGVFVFLPRTNTPLTPLKGGIRDVGDVLFALT